MDQTMIELREDKFLLDDNGVRYRWNKTTEQWDKQPEYDVFWDAHFSFAQLDQDGNVVWMTHIDKARLLDDNNNHNEELGIDYCKQLFGAHTNWAQSGYVRNNAELGRYFDKDKKLFLHKQPYPSWVLIKENNYSWVAPKPYPDSKKYYQWDEDKMDWVYFIMEDK